MNALATDSDAISYVSAVLSLYLELPETPLRTSGQDQRCARQLYDRRVSLRVVESAFLLASLRRLLRPADAPQLSPIRSLAYFQPVIAELLTNPDPKTIWSTCVSNCGISPAARSPRRGRQMFKKLRFQMIDNSLSPRVRGNPILCKVPYSIPGSIPARAGEPGLRRLPAWCIGSIPARAGEPGTK